MCERSGQSRGEEGLVQKLIIEICEGASKTLFISAIKTNLDKAARLVNGMSGAFRPLNLFKILCDEIKPGF